jgi:hypothetical protein
MRPASRLASGFSGHSTRRICERAFHEGAQTMCGLTQPHAWFLSQASVAPVSKEQKVSTSTSSGAPQRQAEINEVASAVRGRFMVSLVRARGRKIQGGR